MFSKKIGERLRPFVPAAAARLLYRGYYFLFAVLAKIFAPTLQVWPRHSLVVGPLEFGRSDIDVTALSSGAPRSESLLRILWLFPVIREINWYREEELSLISQLMNPVEARRDPFLSRKFSSLRALSEAHQTVFLLRTAESLRDQILRPAKWQPRKWRSYFKLAELAAPPASPAEFFQRLEHRQPGAGLLTKEFLEAQDRGEALHLTLERWTHEGRAALAFGLFPHRFCFSETPPAGLETYTEIMRAQMEWEVWGALTQSPGPFPPGMHRHVENLQRWASKVFGTEPSSLSAIISKILRER